MREASAPDTVRGPALLRAHVTMFRVDTTYVREGAAIFRVDDDRAYESIDLATHMPWVQQHAVWLFYQKQDTFPSEPIPYDLVPPRPRSAADAEQEEWAMVLAALGESAHETDLGIALTRREPTVSKNAEQEEWARVLAVPDDPEYVANRHPPQEEGREVATEVSRDSPQHPYGPHAGQPTRSVDELLQQHSGGGHRDWHGRNQNWEPVRDSYSDRPVADTHPYERRRDESPPSRRDSPDPHRHERPSGLSHRRYPPPRAPTPAPIARAEDLSEVEDTSETEAPSTGGVLGGVVGGVWRGLTGWYWS